MGITLETLDSRGLVSAVLDGVSTLMDHHAAMAKVRTLAERGALLALVIDGRRADLSLATSLTNELWEELMSTVGPCAVAYVPPHGFTPAREAVVRRAAEDWDCRVAFHTTPEGATGWCLEQLAV